MFQKTAAIESSNMSASSKPFPAMKGGCICNTVRYRLLTAPLYCYACHCPDCQKLTGSAFGLFLSIEAYNVKVISPTPPTFVKRQKKPGAFDVTAECPRCTTQLWSHGALGALAVEIRIGTLDFPALMEPDVHIFVESKLDWVHLPEGTKTRPRFYDMRQMWPKSSLKRLEICMRRAEEEVEKRRSAGLKDHQGGGEAPGAAEEVATEDGGGGEGEKTPTAAEFGVEDDEEYEKRFREMEKALQERLERLSLKLEEGDDAEKKAATCTPSAETDA
ncbi:glutathione-dependent formaldehyde-activating [Pyrenophora seminiperda CCB06]|uniref:Glutathione-dependent formaldehyde-activating n=1 Tax=Pyrenophora seminiperda CCB06 TaxID=1302712 RepID=A0A3M7M8P7_9PLEO|nr:glutathione-dependent formaldehyde-activating [Pyrenophora seminiperda CCB06]